MGRERNRQRQHVRLCFTAALMIAWSACADARLVPERMFTMPERWEHLDPVQARIDTRDFDGAVADYQAVLAKPGNINADLALFDMGLLYLHYANPHKDYQKSLSCFQSMVNEFPRSPLVEEARILIHLLDTMERAKRVDIELEEKMKELK